MDELLAEEHALLQKYLRKKERVVLAGWRAAEYGTDGAYLWGTLYGLRECSCFELESDFTRALDRLSERGWFSIGRREAILDTLVELRTYSWRKDMSDNL